MLHKNALQTYAGHYVYIENMSSLTIIFALVLLNLLMVLQPALSAHANLRPVTMETDDVGSCLSQEKRDSTIQNLTASIQSILHSLFDTEICNNWTW